MATIAVGDIHGCLPALVDLLDQLRNQITAADRVVFLGDYIDRGPDTKGCLEAVLEFRRDVNAPVVCLCGNHEDWLLRTLHDHRRHSVLVGSIGGARWGCTRIDETSLHHHGDVVPRLTAAAVALASGWQEVDAHQQEA